MEKNPNISLGLPILIRMMYVMAYDKEERKLYMWARKDAIENNHKSMVTTTNPPNMQKLFNKVPFNQEEDMFHHRNNFSTGKRIKFSPK